MIECWVILNPIEMSHSSIVRLHSSLMDWKEGWAFHRPGSRSDLDVAFEHGGGYRFHQRLLDHFILVR